MEERLKNYLAAMERMVAELEEGGCRIENATAQTGEDGKDAQDIKAVQVRRRQLQRAKNELLVQIGFFQHERLIHLIVTVLFALLAMLVLIWVKADFAPESALLLLLLLLLLIPYIRHYYILENGTQKLYRYYDRLETLLEEIP